MASAFPSGSARAGGGLVYQWQHGNHTGACGSYDAQALSTSSQARLPRRMVRHGPAGTPRDGRREPSVERFEGWHRRRVVTRVRRESGPEWASPSSADVRDGPEVSGLAGERRRGRVGRAATPVGLDPAPVRWPTDKPVSGLGVIEARNSRRCGGTTLVRRFAAAATHEGRVGHRTVERGSETGQVEASP